MFTGPLRPKRRMKSFGRIIPWPERPNRILSEASRGMDPMYRIDLCRKRE